MILYFDIHILIKHSRAI